RSLNGRQPERLPSRTHHPPWTLRRAYAKCSNDSMRAGPGFHSRGERRLLRELRDSLDIIRAAVRTLRIGGHRSIGSAGSRTVGSEPGSRRRLGRVTTQSARRNFGTLRIQSIGRILRLYYPKTSALSQKFQTSCQAWTMMLARRFLRHAARAPHRTPITQHSITLFHPP